MGPPPLIIASLGSNTRMPLQLQSRWRENTHHYVRWTDDSRQWTMPIRDWKAALNRFNIQFEDRSSIFRGYPYRKFTLMKKEQASRGSRLPHTT